MQSHLIHIGFPKCASTFLQDWFAAHPQVAYKPNGLAALYTINDLIQMVLEEPGLEKCRVTSAEQISIAKAPTGIGTINAVGSVDQVDHVDSQRQVQRVERLCGLLATMFPDARILMITRNRLDLTLSAYSQIVKEGFALSAGNFKGEAAVSLDLSDLLDFDQVLKLYRTHFGGRVLALPYELLVDNRAAFLAAIADFMDVDDFDIAAVRVNEALDAGQLYWYPRITGWLGRVPSAGLRRRLLSLHRRFICIGAWRPLLIVLERIFGAKDMPRTVTPEVRDRLAINCEELLNLEQYAPYRDLYRGSHASTASSVLRRAGAAPRRPGTQNRS
jgi:hypothetical protein